MAALTMGWSDLSGIRTLERATKQLGPTKVRRAAASTLNHSGGKGKTVTRRATARQTGLNVSVINKAMRVKRANTAKLEYRIDAHGGDISLKYFAARETLRGVSAKPRNNRKVFDGTFIKGGRFPGRVALNMNGQVFARTGAARMPIEKQKSGVIIPQEMIRDESGRAWQRTIASTARPRMEHELKRLAGKAFT